MQTSVWFNGARIDVDNVPGVESSKGSFPGSRQEKALPVNNTAFDRGLAFGDGVFETMLLRAGKSGLGSRLLCWLSVFLRCRF